MGFISDREMLSVEFGDCIHVALVMTLQLPILLNKICSVRDYGERNKAVDFADIL